ncbi:MAG TPA: glycogen debranching N-terminal domain-containing protein [Terriglobia bacterium]|nr:glycogen debranching N-terminal domain-containing protein [Terriglobia bacterium]
MNGDALISETLVADGLAAESDFESQFYIHGTSSFAGGRLLALKSGHMFGLFDHYGDVHPFGEQGIFNEGTRFLSLLSLKVGKSRPLYLSSAAKMRNDTLVIDLSNPDFHNHCGDMIPRGTIHICRSIFLWNGTCHQSLEFTNFGIHPVEFQLVLRSAADFVDIFEVRGMRRERRGLREEPQRTDRRVAYGYEGLDHVYRRTVMEWSPAAEILSDGGAMFTLSLGQRESTTIYISIDCEIGRAMPTRVPYSEALRALVSELGSLHSDFLSIESSSGAFNDSLNRSCADLCMLVTHTPEGLYPYAGVPWFSAPFGRDGIITAMQLLWVNPAIARGVLSFLAAAQAKTVLPSADATPGKIVHEMRRGEMANLGEIPFRMYYGSVDATPLFIMLAGAYYECTGDRAFIETLWPNIEAALNWLDRYGDEDSDGFVEYSRQSEAGLTHQGWKDSRDSISHAYGALAEGAIALCEVQGYAYAAKLAAARLSAFMGDKTGATELERKARALKEMFERAFWCESKSTYALALDGKKRRCDVRSSNAGHCLFTGIASASHAALVVRGLMAEGSFSGWGIRTLDASEVRYNPMSYHNGSVWPHDNAIIAQGFSAYGFKEEALRILTALCEISRNSLLYRLPELICGFPRTEDHGPTLYPVACSPQAWAAGSLYMALQACLGLRVDAIGKRLLIEYPVLPAFIKDLHIRNLRVGSALVDLSLHRHPDSVGVNVDRRTGPVEIVVVK